MSKAKAKRATNLPIFPHPTMPRVLPSSSLPLLRLHPPALSRASLSRQLSQGREKEPECQLGDAAGVRSLGSPDFDAPRLRRRQIDVVHARPVPTYDPKLACLVQNRRADALDARDVPDSAGYRRQELGFGRLGSRTREYDIETRLSDFLQEGMAASRKRAWRHDYIFHRFSYRMTARPSSRSTRLTKPSVSISP